MTEETNESKDWKKLDEKEKSYTVRVLNWFHFRTNRQSWLKEETITWELVRLLQIIPYEYLLKNFLIKIKEKNTSISKIIDLIISEINNAKIEPYPYLRLKGNKNKSRSDIEIKTDNSCLWIEVKTQLIKEKLLLNQINKQINSPNFIKNKNKAIIVLIPENQEYSKEKITWREIFIILEESYKSIKSKNNKILRGYELMLEEIINRIRLRNYYIKK
ncbi:MAG: hypothetical protein ABIH65_01465 [Nanoarchaeota archaeon]